jgi:hypothetical protein
MNRVERRSFSSLGHSGGLEHVRTLESNRVKPASFNVLLKYYKFDSSVIVEILQPSPSEAGDKDFRTRVNLLLGIRENVRFNQKKQAENAGNVHMTDGFWIPNMPYYRHRLRICTIRLYWFTRSDALLALLYNVRA